MTTLTELDAMSYAELMLAVSMKEVGTFKQVAKRLGVSAPRAKELVDSGIRRIAKGLSD